MTTSPLLDSRIRRASVTERLEVAQQAAAKAERLHGERLLGRVIGVHPALAGLLPDGGLRVGGVYGVHGSHALLAAVLATPSSQGQWCGVVGMPGFAAEAARALGCDLDRMVFVPRPGPDWLNVVGALIDALPIVAVSPPGPVSPGESSRITARLRKRGSVLVATGRWPRVDARLTAGASRWQGLGDGHGHLTARLITVEASGRATSAEPREHSLWLPHPTGEIVPAEAASSLRAIAG